MRVIVARILKQVKTAFCVCFVVLYGHLKYGFWVHFWRSVLFHKTYSAVCSLESGPPHAWWSLPCPCGTWCSSCSATPWTPGPLSWQQLSTCPVLKKIAIISLSTSFEIRLVKMCECLKYNILKKMFCKTENLTQSSKLLPYYLQTFQNNFK